MKPTEELKNRLEAAQRIRMEELEQAKKAVQGCDKVTSISQLAFKAV